MKVTATTTFLDGYMRFEEGFSYNVSPARGHFFVGFGWADEASASAELTEPLDVRTLTLDQALEMKAKDKARATKLQGRPEPDLDVQGVDSAQGVEM